jgi:rhamnose transport system ATP-binding protein
MQQRIKEGKSIKVESMLALNNITKKFTGTLALSEVDFDLYPGEIHALVGENGAGKSTLIKIITGIYQADVGEILLSGNRVVFPDARASYDHGIAAIYQEASLFEDLSIAENIYIGHQEIRPITRNIKWGALYTKAQEFIKSLEVNLDPRALVKSLSIAEKQLVEIIKALSADAKILIMDEPTSSLTKEEIDYLFRIARKLRSEGTGIIFISHRLEEVFEIADRVTVIRDGKKVGTVEKQDLNVDELVRMMVGRNLKTLYPKTEATIGESVLRVEKLSRAGEFNNVTFELRRGEILGLAGLVGAGRTEVARTIYGVEKPEEGSIFLEGKPVTVDTPRRALDLGIAYLSESRGEYGLVLPMTITHNITVPILKRFSRFGWIDRGEERTAAKKFYDLLDIRASGLDQKVESLSGGNQQKVSIAKWLAANAKILILDEPTKGIDVGTKAAVHKLMSDLANEGRAILMISSEIPEIIGMSDRILVMNEGVIVSEITRDEATQEKILTAALGEKGKPSYSKE